MSIQLQKEIDKLKKMILKLSARVEENVRDTLIAVQHNNIELAQEVRDRDKKVDSEEVNIEEECLKILALHQPVATDLRFIIAVLKINTELERISDLAKNIVKRVKILKANNIKVEKFDFIAMGENVRAMLRNAIISLIKCDIKMANQVLNEDDAVDAFNKAIVAEVKEEIKTNPQMLDPFLQIILVSRYLERLADCTTNIAEDVIYMIDGIIVRHSTIKDKSPK